MKLVTVIMISVLCAVSAVSAESPNPKTPIGLIGYWVATEIQSKGEETPPEIQIDLEFTKTQMIMHFGDRLNKPIDVFDCFSVAKDDRQCLDLVSADQSRAPDKQIHIHAIYDVNGDTLRICAASRNGTEPPVNHPTKFASTPDPKTDLIVLKRRPK
ncbi:TIGR03067 domain-containing protein [Rubripirellula tenax]|nr:TIGR03067 domain-containing protein [Rubripirellula tenax]